MAWPPFFAYSPSACRMMVDLPMPGSPPTSSAEPGTSPPPVTRSNSAMPVTRRGGGASSVLRSSRANLRPLTRRRGAAADGRGGAFFGDGVPAAAGFALARPFGRGRAAGLADKGGGGFGHDSEPSMTVKQASRTSPWPSHGRRYKPAEYRSRSGEIAPRGEASGRAHAKIGAFVAHPLRAQWLHDLDEGGAVGGVADIGQHRGMEDDKVASSALRGQRGQIVAQIPVHHARWIAARNRQASSSKRARSPSPGQTSACSQRTSPSSRDPGD